MDFHRPGTVSDTLACAACLYDAVEIRQSIVPSSIGQSISSDSVRMQHAEDASIEIAHASDRRTSRAAARNRACDAPHGFSQLCSIGFAAFVGLWEFPGHETGIVCELTKSDRQVGTRGCRTTDRRRGLGPVYDDPGPNTERRGPCGITSPTIPRREPAVPTVCTKASIFPSVCSHNSCPICS